MPTPSLPVAFAVVALTCAVALAGCEVARADAGKAAALGASPPGVTSAFVPGVSIYRSYPSLGMNTGRTDLSGKPARAPCLTCHSFLAPNDAYKNASKLDKFHKGVEVKHGGQSCRTCHAVPGLSAFNLAGGETVSYDEVMRLCSQCHAQRRKEYDRGAHGGMAGHWDLGSGPRTRNHCIDCHNPHAPAVAPMVPAPMPNDRFAH